MHRMLCPSRKFVLILFALSTTPVFASSDTLTLGSDGTVAPVSLDPGVYNFSAIGGGWNAWGGFVELPEVGWLCNAEILVDGAYVASIWSPPSPTPATAISSCSNAEFVVCKNDNVQAFVPDPVYTDNVGSVTVSIQRLSPVNEGGPASCPEEIARERAKNLANLASFFSFAGVFTVQGQGLSLLNGLAKQYVLQLLAVGPAVIGSYTTSVPRNVAFEVALVQAGLLAINTTLNAMIATYVSGAAPPLAIFDIALLVAGSVSGFSSIAFQYIANDPPDFDYMEVYESNYDPVHTNGVNSPTIVDAVSTFNLANQIADALFVATRSAEKYEGAVIDAQAGADTAGFQLMQLVQIAKYLDVAESAHQQLAGAVAAYNSHLSVGIEGAASVTPTEFDNIISTVAVSDIPPEISAVLTDFGVAEQDYRALGQQALSSNESEISTADYLDGVQSIPLEFGEMIENTREIMGIAILDLVEADRDEDGVVDLLDNCLEVANEDQVNTDNSQDGGDACDVDDDNDGWQDAADNCALDYNPEQLDTDSDGIGDVCDLPPGCD